MTHIVLSPAIQVLLRPNSTIQFGVDAQRAGILELDSADIAAGVVPTLVGMRVAKPIEDVVDKLENAGLNTAAAHSLLEDLLSYGIIRSAKPALILILGRGTLLDATVPLLESAGFFPRIAQRHEQPSAFLQIPAAEVLILNRLAQAHLLAPVLKNRVPRYLSAALLDSRGLIGPGRRDYRGACPMCMDLHRIDIDPYWHTLVSQQPNGPTNPDPITEAATAARIAALIRTGNWSPDTTEEIDPYAGTITSESIQSHPRCPVCWS